MISLRSTNSNAVHHQQERWKQQFINNINSALPTGEYENGATWQTLLPRARAALLQKPRGQESRIVWAMVLYNTAWYMWKIGQGQAAEEISIQALTVRREFLGSEYEDTLESMLMLGLIYAQQGYWDAAEKLEVEVTKRRKKSIGYSFGITNFCIASIQSCGSDFLSLSYFSRDNQVQGRRAEQEYARYKRDTIKGRLTPLKG